MSTAPRMYHLRRGVCSSAACLGAEAYIGNMPRRHHAANSYKQYTHTRAERQRQRQRRRQRWTPPYTRRQAQKDKDTHAAPEGFPSPTTLQNATGCRARQQARRRRGRGGGGGATHHKSNQGHDNSGKLARQQAYLRWRGLAMILVCEVREGSHPVTSCTVANQALASSPPP